MKSPSNTSLNNIDLSNISGDPISITSDMSGVPEYISSASTLSELPNNKKIDSIEEEEELPQFKGTNDETLPLMDQIDGLEKKEPPVIDEEFNDPDAIKNDTSKMTFIERIKYELIKTQETRDLYPVIAESFIDIPPSVLLSGMVDHAKEAQDAVVSDGLTIFFKALSTYYHVFFHNSVKDLLDDYGFFDEATSRQRRKMEKLDISTIDIKENNFLDRLAYILKKADYKIMSQAKIRESAKSSYLCQLDVKLELSELDSDVTTRFIQRNNYPDAALVNKHVLIFHRGIGVDSTSDYFMQEKVELFATRLYRLTNYYVLKFFKKETSEDSLRAQKEGTSNKFIEALRSYGLHFPKDANTQILMAVCVLVHLWAIMSSVINISSSQYKTMLTMALLNISVLIFEFLLFFRNPGSELLNTQDDDDEALYAALLDTSAPNNINVSGTNTQTEKPCAYVERLRLESIPLTPADILTKNTMQEPTFQDTIVVYRPVGSYNLNIKHFKDIPIADLELVYPTKRVNCKLTDSITLLVSVAASTITLLSGLLMKSNQSDNSSMSQGQSQDNGIATAGSNVFYSLGLTFLGSAGFSVYSYINKKSEYVELLNKTLYDKQGGTNISTILYVVNSCEEQELKEVTLGYYTLLAHGRLRERELAESIEKYVYDTYKKRIAVDISNILNKLIGLGLITRTGNFYNAIPLGDAAMVVNKRWSELDIGFGSKNNGNLLNPLNAVGALGTGMATGVNAVTGSSVNAGKSVFKQIGKIF